jgi:hypothetical protein
MDGKRLDEWSKALTGSRRTALTSGAALALGGLLSALSPRTARARKRTLKPAYTCPPPAQASASFAPGIRLAQSFTARRSGTLRQIKIGISKPSSLPGGDYVVQLVKMAGTVPSENAIDVIAAAVVPDAQVKTGKTTLIASFGTTRLTQGTKYAVVVSRPSNLRVFQEGGDFCEGDPFIAPSTGNFTPFTSVGDMVVTVLVA